MHTSDNEFFEANPWCELILSVLDHYAANLLWEDVLICLAYKAYSLNDHCFYVQSTEYANFIWLTMFQLEQKDVVVLRIGLLLLHHLRMHFALIYRSRKMWFLCTTDDALFDSISLSCRQRLLILPGKDVLQHRTRFLSVQVCKRLKLAFREGKKSSLFFA